MIVECPKCKKKYRVKESDIPIGGCPVKCPNCGNIFTIYRAPLNIHLEPVVEHPQETQPFVSQQIPTKTTPPIVESQPPFMKPAESLTKVPPTMGKKEEKPTLSGAERLKAALGLEGAKDEFPAEWSDEKKRKHRSAKRLAKSLAKDLLLYHKDKVEQGLREGNLAKLLGEEIKKSWSFYKKSVDPEILSTSNYFKDALNEIIGKGRKIFV